MKDNRIYQSLVSTLSRLVPLFAKAMIDNALKKNNLTIDTAGPLDYHKIISEDIDPKLGIHLKGNSSFVYCNSGLFVFNLEKKIVYQNEPFKKLMLDLFSSVNTEDLYSDLEKMGIIFVPTEANVIGRDIYLEKLGRPYLIFIAKIPSTNQFLVILRDITLRESLRNELEAYASRLKIEIEKRIKAESALEDQYLKNANSARMSAVGEMAGGVAHEINNPLAVILGRVDFVEKLLDKKELSEESLKENLKKIRITGQKIAKIVKGLRDFSRDGSKDPFEDVLISRIIDEAFSLCSERIRNQQVKIEVQPYKDETIPCRSVQLAQVLVNLFSNSLYAVKDQEEKWVVVTVEYPDDDWVLISVTDSGPKLDEFCKQKIMTPFFTTKPIGQGTGLGLSISRSMAVGHGGILYLDDKSERTKFTMKVPRRTDVQLQAINQINANFNKKAS